MSITALSNIQLRNQVRGALSNTSTPAKLTSLASARPLLNNPDTTIFTNILCTTDLEDTFYGPPFPPHTSSLFRINRRHPIALELELTIQLHTSTPSSRSIARRCCRYWTNKRHFIKTRCNCGISVVRTFFETLTAFPHFLQKKLLFSISRYFKLTRLPMTVLCIPDRHPY